MFSMLCFQMSTYLLLCFKEVKPLRRWHFSDLPLLSPTKYFYLLIYHICYKEDVEEIVEAK